MLRVRVCGGLEVEAEGRALPDALLGGRQGRLVLAYLICERRRAVRREELAELLWADRLPDSWSASLSAVISRLRKLLTEAGLDGTEAITSAAGAYQLVLPGDAEIDLEVLEAAVAEAEAAAEADDAAIGVAAAERAEAIGARGFLADDCDWVDRQRVAVRDLRVRAALARSSAQLGAGSPARAVDAARDALALDETREASYRQLMRALAAAGERAEALRVWERCRTTLVEELGVDPSPETEAVYVEVLNAAGAVPVAPPATTTALPSGVVTFLLTDIVESSTLWDQAPDAMALALDRHDSLIAELVAGHGGTLLKSKLEGDATVSVFARASDGAAAALSLLAAIEDEAWPEGAPLRLRMAMHTGEAFERGGDYFGPALNRAARLRSLAGAGEVLLSQAVTELVRDHLPAGGALRDLGHRDLRGLSRGENVCALQRAAAPGEAEVPVAPATGTGVLTPPPLPPPLTGTGPFVGRGDELHKLVELWDQAAAGSSGAAFIGGEPGVGKSRLASEIAAHAHEAGAIVLYGRCDEELAAPLQPFIEALRTLVPALGPARTRAVRGVDELARVVPELAEQLPDRAPAVRADPDTERLALFDAVTNLLTAASTEAPMLLVLDDLHWAGKTTLSLLRHVLRGAKGARLLVVGTYRDTELARTHPLAETLADLRRDSDATRVSLSGLGAEDIEAYLAAIGIDDRALGRELAEVTSGNPFFLIEVVRHVEETGGAWSPGNLPEGVREATGRRLSRLSDPTNQALSVAAVVGAVFDLALVEQAHGGDLVDEIDEACRAGLVVEEPGSIGRFRFAHALVRQVLLSELVTVKRVRLHKTIAELLESAPVGDDHDARLADLAYHWSECASLGDAGKAVDACRRAADRAMERLAYEEAGDLYGMALQVLDTGDDAAQAAAAELHLARCDALLTAGDVTAARGAIDALEGAAGGSERLAAWYTTYEGLLAVLAEPDRLIEIVQSIGAAAGAMREIGDLRGEARAHYVHASALERLGQIGSAERALDAALAAARTADDRRLADSILAEAPPAALWGPSSVTRASGRCLDVVRVLRINDGAPAVEAVALRCQAVLEALRGRADAARRMIGSARRTVERLGLTHRLLETELMAGFIELIDGNATEAEVLLRRAYEGLRERGLGGEAAQAAAFLGRSLLLQDRVDEADEVAAEAETLAGSDLKAAIAWRDVRAECAAHRGDATRALALANEAVELAAATDALLLVVDARLTLATVLRATGEVAGAEDEARRAVEACEAKGATALAARARGAAPGPVREAAFDPVELALARAELHRPEVAAAPNLAANEAVRGAHHFHQMFNRGALDEIPGQRHPDFRWEDRRRVLSDRVLQAEEGADANLIENTAIAHRSGAKFGPEQVLVVRGEHLALVRVELRGPSAEWTYLIVVRTAPDGRLLDYVMFDTEDRTAANVELDRLTPEELDTENLAWRSARRFAAAANRHDWEGFLAGLAPSYQRLDRRTTLLHVPTDADTLEVHRTMFSLDDFSMERNLIDTAGDRRALVHDLVWFRDGSVGEAEVPGLSLFEVDEDGLIVRHVGYDEEGLEAALVDLRRPDTPGPTIAVRVVQSLAAAINAREWDAVRGLIDPAAPIDDRRPGVSAPRSATVTAAYELLFTMDDWSLGQTVLETAGERRVLVHHRVGFRTLDVSEGEIESLQVYDVDETGRIVHMTSYAVDDLDAARVELRAAAAQTIRTLAAQAVRRFSDAVNAHDWDALLAVFAPGAQQVDRRSWISPAEPVDPVEMNRTLFSLDDWGSDDEPIEAHGDRRVLVKRTTRFRDGASGWAEVPTLTVVEVDVLGRITLHVGLDPDDLEAARAELRSVPAVPPPQENAAWAAALRMPAAVSAHDWDAFVALFAPECEVRSERHVAQGPLRGSDAPEAYRMSFDVPDFTWHRSLVASRGDHLALTVDFVSFVGRAVGPGEVSILSVLECAADGRIAGIVSFEPDDIDAAMAELEARASRSAASRFENEAWRAALRMRDACVAQDRERFLATIADGFEYHDNRSAVQLHLVGEDAPKSHDSIFGLDDIAWDRSLRGTRGDRLALVHDRITFADQAAGEAEITSLTVVASVPSGRVLRTAAFAEDDVAGAYDELERLWVEQGGPDVRAYYRTIAARDWDRFQTFFHPHALIVDHRWAGFGQLGRDQFVEFNRRDHAEELSDYTAWIDHVLTSEAGVSLLVGGDAGRQDGSAFEVITVTVTQVDSERRITRLDMYGPDQVAEARAEYDRLVAEAGTGPQPNAAYQAQLRLEAAFNAQDIDRVRAELSPAFKFNDRRSTMLVDLDGEEALSVFRVGVDLEHFHLTDQLLEVRGDRLALIAQQAVFQDGASGPAEISTLTVIESDAAGQMTRHVVFEATAMIDALAELDALAAVAATGGLEPNEAWRVSELFVAAYNAQDRQALEAIHSPGYSYHDRRSTLTVIDFYGEEAFRQFDMAMSLDEFVLERRLLATRGDHLVLVEEVARFRDGAAGPSELPCLTVFEIDGDGLALRNICFDMDARDEALAELGARHTAGDAWRPTPNAAWAACLRQKQASDEASWAAFEATYDPAIVYNDNRLGMWAPEGSDPLSIHRSMFEMDEWSYWRTLLATRGDRLALVRTTCRFVTGMAGPAEVTTVSVVDVGPDGLIVHEAAYDVDQLDAAVAELDARWEAHQGATNLAWRAMAQLSGRSDELTWEQFEAQFDPDGTWEDRRRGLRLAEGANLLTAQRALWEVDEWAMRRSLVATRGDHLALVRTITTLRDGTSGPAEVETLAVVEVAPDGRVRHQVLFEADDHELATAELDRRFAELEAGDAAMAELHERQRLLEDPMAIPRTLAVRSVEQPGWTLVAAIGEHVCLHDTSNGTVVHEVDDAGQVVAALTFSGGQRRASFNELVRRGYTRLGFPDAALRITLAVNDGDLDAVADHLAEGCTVEDHRHLRSPEAQGGEHVGALLRSYEELAPGHLLEVRRFEYPEPDPWGHLCVIALTGTTADGAAFESPYVSVACWDERGLMSDLAMYEIEDIDLARAHLESRRPARSTIDDPLVIHRNLAVRSAAQPGWTLLAALGDHLCLHDTGDRLVLHEVDDAGDVIAFLAFRQDDRPTAAGEVARRCYERMGVPTSVAGAIASINAHDIDAVRAAYSPSCRFEDHRSLRVLTMSEYEDASSGWLTGGIELTPDFSVEVLRIDAIEPWGLVILNRQAGTTPDGTSFETFTLSASCWGADGRLRMIAVYDPEDLEAALARLAAEGPDVDAAGVRP